MTEKTLIKKTSPAKTAKENLEIILAEVLKAKIVNGFILIAAVDGKIIEIDHEGEKRSALDAHVIRTGVIEPGTPTGAVFLYLSSSADEVLKALYEQTMKEPMDVH